MITKTIPEHAEYKIEKKTICKYKADDGTIFNSREECQFYENGIREIRDWDFIFGNWFDEDNTCSFDLYYARLDTIQKTEYANKKFNPDEKHEKPNDKKCNIYPYVDINDLNVYEFYYEDDEYEYNSPVNIIPYGFDGFILFNDAYHMSYLIRKEDFENFIVHEANKAEGE